MSLASQGTIVMSPEGLSTTQCRDKPALSRAEGKSPREKTLKGVFFVFSHSIGHDDSHGFFCYTTAMSDINPIGGGGNSPDMNRRKTPEERAEEAAGRLRNSIKRSQASFRQRLKERQENPIELTPGISPDTGKGFDSALLSPEEQNPPAKGDNDEREKTDLIV